jgi:hypothetical protein
MTPNSSSELRVTDVAVAGSDSPGGLFFFSMAAVAVEGWATMTAAAHEHLTGKGDKRGGRQETSFFGLF